MTLGNGLKNFAKTVKRQKTHAFMSKNSKFWKEKCHKQTKLTL